MKSNAAFGVIYGTVEISSVGSTAYWGDLAVLVALTTLKWTGAGFGLLVALVVALVAHLTYKLSSRWSKLKVAALHEAEVIKKRKQGPTWDAQEILPGVWLGSFPAAIKADELRRRNISHVLSIGSEFSPVYPEQFCYMVAFAMDCPGQNIVDYFEHTNRFIDSALSSGSAVLVHCQAGISRSASLVAAYLLAQQGLTSNQVLASIRTIRPCIAPNPGFQKQLQVWEHMVNGHPNVPSIRRWALSGVWVGPGCIALYQDARGRPQFILGNRLKDYLFRLGYQALLAHGATLARTSWGARLVTRIIGQY